MNIRRRQLDKTIPAPAAGNARNLQSGNPAWSIWEGTLIGAIVLAGISIRLWALYLTSVEHFDEGVYASNVWFDETASYQYPMRYMYAPPLLPGLIEGTIILSGRATGLTAIVPSLVAGCLTVAVVWWSARNLFGPVSAIVAACLAAFSDVHAVFTRAALTDVLLLLFMMAAMWLLERACRTKQIVDFVIAGAVTGLGWWTKYNGWLPLVIALVALVARWLVDQPRRPATARLLKGWCIAAATAVLVWSPYVYSLQSVGGYAQVAANHRQFVVGAAGWFPSLTRQIANLRYVDSLLDSLGWGIAVLAAGIVQCRMPLLAEYPLGAAVRNTVAPKGYPATRGTPTWKQWGGIAAASLMAVAMAQWLGGSVLCLTLGALGIAGHWINRPPFAHHPSAADGRNQTGGRGSRRAAPAGGFAIGSRLGRSLALPNTRATCTEASDTETTRCHGMYWLSAWFMLLLILTPLYTPYLRLILPLLGASWLASGRAVATLLRLASGQFAPRPDAQRSAQRPLWLYGVLVALCVGISTAAAVLSAHKSPLVWRDDRRGLERIAAQIRESIERSTPPNVTNAAAGNVFYVYGEPALLFHLRAAGEPVVVPTNFVDLRTVQLEGRPLPTYFVCGLHALNDSAFRHDFAQTRDRFELLQTFTYHPSAMVLLDHYDPRTTPIEERSAEVQLYRLR